MDKADLILLGLLTALSFAAAALRILLAQKQGSPLPLVWRIQSFVFPAALLLALVLFLFGIEGPVLPLVGLGLLEEIVCGVVRRKLRNRETS